MTSIRFLTFTLLAIAITQINGYYKCKTVHSVPVNEDWIKDVADEGNDGWFTPMHSNCENCAKKEAWKWLTGGRALGNQESTCWKTDLVSKYGPITLPFSCKYFRFQEQSCHLDTSRLKGKAKNKFGFGAEVLITLTDNSTFLAGTGCIYGKENWWWVASTKEELEEDTKETVLEHFSKLGFKTDNLAEEGDWKKSPIIFKKMHITNDECAD